MSSGRGTIIDRVLTFYRTASPDTVRVTHQLAGEIIAERGIGGRKVKDTVKRRAARRTSQTDEAAKVAAAAGATS